MNAVCDALDMKSDQVVLWSDSKIVLCWLQRLKTESSVFVRNHVMKIHKLQPDANWRHVSSRFNPADVVSRGLFPKELMASDLWWNGPPFLRINEGYEDEEDTVISVAEEKEEYSDPVMTVIVQENHPYKKVMATSNFRRLQRVFGYVARFIFNCKSKTKSDKSADKKLTLADLDNGLKLIVKCVMCATRSVC